MLEVDLLVGKPDHMQIDEGFFQVQTEKICTLIGNLKVLAGFADFAFCSAVLLGRRLQQPFPFQVVDQIRYC